MKFKFFILLVLYIFACTKISPIIKEETLINELPDSFISFDIITWNIEEFPIHHSTTSKVISIVDSLKPKIIAFQEITSESQFQEITNQIPQYLGYRSSTASYGINLAFIWDSTYVKNIEIYEILTWQSYPLPRSPLVMECNINNLDFIIINNHLKAYHDSESIERRRQAIILLENYIDTYYQNDNLILLGDLNDSLDDPFNYNIFTPFLNAPNSYLFVDQFFEMENYSYPSYPSHIDHILISNELYEFYNSQYTEVYTIKLEETIENYFNQVSDHLPVYLKLVF